MEIRIGLTGNDLSSQTHPFVSLESKDSLWLSPINGKPARQVSVAAGTRLTVTSRDGQLIVEGALGQSLEAAQSLTIRPFHPASAISVLSLVRTRGDLKVSPEYIGFLEIVAFKNQVAVIVTTSLESYVKGVLGSEIPASYHLEAIKAQAVAARTYALHPRINHTAEGFNVCDSYLCCQYFAGIVDDFGRNYSAAIDGTQNQIVSYKDEPILALFSSCAGGHTENFENCFSDPQTNQFPPGPLTYLKGTAEGGLPSGFPSEYALSKLWELKHPNTVDGWSPNFAWQVHLSEAALEGQMHHVIDSMRHDPRFSPFIIAPPSNQFGHIRQFEMESRGVSGMGIVMSIHTSTGTWKIIKELTIRNVFKNPELKLGPLKSARILFEHRKNQLGLLSLVTIKGLGFGHAVGLQQTGAQGWASKGRSYKEILAHYYRGTAIEEVRT